MENKWIKWKLNYTLFIWRAFTGTCGQEVHLLIWKPGLVKKILIHQNTVVNNFPSSQLVQLILDFIISVVITFNSCWGTRNTQTTSVPCFKLCLLRIKTTVFRCKTRRTQQKSCDACARMAFISAYIMVQAMGLYTPIVNTTSHSHILAQWDMHGLIKTRLQTEQQGIYRWQ